MKQLLDGIWKYVKAGRVSLVAGGVGAYFSSALAEMLQGMIGTFDLDFFRAYYEIPIIVTVATIFLWWALRHRIVWAAAGSTTLCVLAFSVAFLMRHAVWASDDTVMRFFFFVGGVMQLGILSAAGTFALLKRMYEELEAAGSR